MNKNILHANTDVNIFKPDLLPYSKIIETDEDMTIEVNLLNKLRSEINVDFTKEYVEVSIEYSEKNPVNPKAITNNQRLLKKFKSIFYLPASIVMGRYRTKIKNNMLVIEMKKVVAESYSV